MRLSAVNHALSMLGKYDINLSSIHAIDIGGTEKVYLETESLRRGARAKVKNYFKSILLPDAYLDREVIVTQNPLIANVKKLKFFDQGFNAGEIDTQSDIEADFLDLANIHPIQDSFDLAFSFDTLEHVRQPFDFCNNLGKIVKPEGYVYLQTVFSWSYHPSPKDFFRFSPDGLIECFKDSGLEVLECDWDVKEISSFIFLRKP
jgi:SAM-dependent methyltransferase